MLLRLSVALFSVASRDQLEMIAQEKDEKLAHIVRVFHNEDCGGRRAERAIAQVIEGSVFFPIVQVRENPSL